ncbi:hypothetical protein KAR34_09675, partial [bacterium]|nr:hypothetical protein [bacterium]
KQACREGEISPLKYGVYLCRYGKRIKLELSSYPNLLLYVSKRRNVIPRKVELEQVYTESEQLDQAIRECLYTSDAQRQLDQLEERLDIMEKLLNISATPKELQAYRENPKAFQVKQVMDFIRQYNELSELTLDTDIYSLDSYLQQVRRFYQMADERSTVFVENTVNRMKEYNTKLAVLVTGGFHTDHVLKEMQARNISYLSLCPRITQEDLVNPYFALIRDRKTPLEKLLAKNQNILKLAPGAPQVLHADRNAILTEMNPDQKVSSHWKIMLNIGLAIAELLKQSIRGSEELEPRFETMVNAYPYKAELSPEWETMAKSKYTSVISIKWLLEKTRIWLRFQLKGGNSAQGRALAPVAEIEKGEMAVLDEKEAKAATEQILAMNRKEKQGITFVSILAKLFDGMQALLARAREGWTGLTDGQKAVLVFSLGVIAISLVGSQVSPGSINEASQLAAGQETEFANYNNVLAAVCGLNMIPRKNKKPELSQKSSVAGFIKDKLLSLGIVWKVGSSLRNIGRRITFGTLFILAAVVIFVVNWGPTKPVTQVTTVSTAEKQPLVISGKDFLEGSPVFAIVGKALNDETFYMGLQPETMRPFYGLTILHKIKLDINKHQRLKIALDITEISDNTMWSLPLSFTGDNGVYFVQDAYFKFQDDTDKKGKLVYEISIQELFDALGIVATQEAAIEVRFAVVSKSTDTKFTSQTQPRLLLNMDNCNITLEPYPKGAERNFEVFEKPAEGAYKDHVRKRFGSVAEAGQIKKQLRQYMPENLIAVWAGMNQNGKAINLNNHNRNTLITHPEYGKIKDIASTNYPWFQDFESYDPVIRKYTIAMLESAGINAIVLEYCAGMDQRDMFLPAFINALNQSDRSFALSLDTRVSLRSTDVLKSHLKFLLDTYATQKSALQINGLALVFLHNLDLMEFTDDDIKRVVEELEAEGYVFILAGDKTGAQWMGANKLSLGFGNYNNQMADIVKKYGADPAQWQSASVANIDPNQPDSLGITLVYPGYDNRFVGGADTYELTKGEPKLFPVWKQTHKLQTPDSDLLAQTVTRAMQKKQNQFMLISSLDGNQTGTELFPSLQKGCDRILEIARLSAAKNGHRSNLTEIIRIAEQAVHDIHQRRGESVPQAILTSIQKAYRTASRRQPEIDKLVKSQESSAFGFIKAMLLSLGGALITFGINVLTDGYEGLLQAGVWGLLVFFAYSAVKWAAIKVAQKNRAKAMADEGKAARPPTLIPALQGYKTFKADADQERRGVLDTVTPEGDSAIEETVAYLPAYFQYTTAAHVWLHQKLHLPEFFAYLLEPIVGSLWMAGSSLRNRAKRVTVGTVFLSGIFILLLFMAPEQWNEACRATYGKQAKANQTQHNQVERIVRGYPRVFNSLNDVLATGKEKRDLDTYKQQSEADDKLADILRIINVQDLMSKAQVGTTIFAVLENEGSVFSFLKGRSLINLLKFLISANKLYWNIYTGVEKIKLYATPAQLQAAKELDLPINSYDIPWQKKVLILPKILAKKHARNTAVNIAPYDWANYFSLKASGQTLEQDHSAMLAHLKKQEADQDIRDNVMEHLELAAKNNLTILFETTVARESFVPLKKLSKSRHEYVRDQIRYVKALRKAWLKKHPDKKPPIGIVLDPWHLTGDMLGPKIKTWLKQGRSRQDIREKELLPLLIKFCDECDGLIAHIDIGNAAPWEIKFLPEELQRGRVMSPDSLVPNLAVIQYLMRTNPDIVNNITLDGSPQAPLMSTRAGKFTLGAIFAALAAFFVMLIKAFKRRLGSAGNDGFTLVEVAFAVTGVAIVVLGVVQPAVFSFAGLMAAVSVAMIAVPLILAIFVQMNKGSRISFSKSVKVGTQVALIICMFIVPSFWTRLYAQVGVDKKIEQVIVDPKRIINITDLFENSRSTGGKIYRQGDKVMIMGHEWCTLPFGSIRSGPIKIDFDSPRTIIKLNIETVTNGWYFIIHSPNLPVAPGGKYIKIWNDNSRKGIQIYDLKKLQRFGLTGEQEVQFEIGVTTYGREKVDNNTKVVLNVSSVLQEPSKATKRIKQRKTEITKTVRLSLADLFKNSNKTGVFLTQQGNQLIIKGDEWCFNTFGSIRSKPIKIDFNSSPGIRLNILDVTHEWYLIVHSPDLADFVKIWPDNSRTGTLTYDLTQLGLEGTKEITLEFGVSSYNTPGHKKVNEQNTVVVIDAQTQLTGVVPTGYIGTEKQAKSKTELTQYFTKSGLHKSLKGGLKSTVQAALVRDQIFKYARIEGNKIYIHAVNWWERPGKGADHWSWYGHYPKIDSTDIASVYHPLLGLYDSSDEEYMEWVIEVLMDMGVDGMNVDYYAGTREHDKWLAKLFEVVEKVNKKNPLGRKFELAVMYETKIIRENYGFADRGVLKEHIKRVLNTYALSPAYQRVAGVPVIYVFGMATTGFQGEDYRQIALELEKEGYIYLLVGDKTYESQYLGDKAAAAVHQWIDMWGLMNMPEVAKLSRDVTKLEARHHALLRTAREMKRVDIMGIAAVYNEFTDKKLGGGDWGRGVHRFLDSRGGDYFEQGDVFKETMKYAIENQDWLLWTLLITWDDWHEGTQMEPSLEKGFSKFFGIMEFAAGYKGFKADPRAVIKRTEKYAHEIYGEKLPPQVNKIIKDALHYASQVDRKIEQKYRNYLKRQAGIEAAKKRHDAEAREKLKAHPFRAAWGFIFGAISGVLSLVLIGLSIYLGTGLDNSLLVLAGIAVSTLFGLYFAMATLGFVRTGRAVYKVMYQSLHQDNPGAGRWTIAWKAFTGAIAWSNGILGNEKAFRILQKEYPKEADRVFYHEQFKNHFIGMLVMFPFVQNYLERKVVQAFLKAPGPLQVESKIQSYVWGQPAKDSFIIRFLNRALNKKQMDINIAELWFGAHKKNPGVVRIAGLPMALDRFAKAVGEPLLGKGRMEIGQLFKILDAKEPFSMQMHERFKPDSKNESWMVVIDRDRLKQEDKDQTIAEIHLGFRPIAEIDDKILPKFRKEYEALHTKAAKIVYFKTQYANVLKKGRTDKEGKEIKAFSNKLELRWENGVVEAYFNGKKQSAEIKKKLGLDDDMLVMNVPGATVHATSYGLIYEVQETCDKTLRLYDQGRNDPNRPLHIEEALEKLDFTPRPLSDYLVKPVELNERTRNLIRTPLYSMDQISLETQPSLDKDTGDDSAVVKVDGYQMLMVKDGEGQLCYSEPDGTEREIQLRRGDTLIVPAFMNSYTLFSKSRLTVLKAYEASAQEITEAQGLRGGKSLWEEDGFFEAPGVEKEEGPESAIKAEMLRLQRILPKPLNVPIRGLRELPVRIMQYLVRSILFANDRSTGGHPNLGLPLQAAAGIVLAGIFLLQSTVAVFACLPGTEPVGTISNTPRVEAFKRSTLIADDVMAGRFN